MTRDTTGLPMRPLHGSPFVFDPGALCLELLVTGAPGAYAHYEILHGPRDLADWLALSRLRLDPGLVGVTEAELGAARRLRDSLWRLADARTGGLPLPPEDVAEVNLAASHPPLVPAMDAGAGRSWVQPAGATAVLSTIARDAVDLFTGDHADRIRECGSPDCRLVFVDTSRPGRRRWCSMERCGNRQKVRALRARREEAEGPP
ncbi:CGNR zinc finger domain-containing protein [Nocardiopsis tropica]|uniref:CGNR zinc finger domain-containing protein n=1 Tax=Nocardiopsis tropica TaxID=109330 RepID=A0ABU7KU74_9ACTN|nr:CGNR zinc finger domain-containing protein [Nocardiopsis umidischolae]MEE2052832.1 CGNR zinc finger domain-containing protein [Nocardiopsis umidischolae]